jgi:hypothetical protein
MVDGDANSPTWKFTQYVFLYLLMGRRILGSGWSWDFILFDGHGQASSASQCLATLLLPLPACKGHG